MTINELYEEITIHLLNDNKPSQYLNKIYDLNQFSQEPFDMLKKLRQTEQSPQYHSEGNVWNHTMLVVDECAKVREKSSDKKTLMWAALLHDTGKPATSREKRGRITAYNHDKVGAELSARFLEHFTQDRDFIKKVSMLIKYHMHILYVVKDLPYGDKKSMLKETDINELALLVLCDRLGRGESDIKEEKRNIEIFLKKCK